MKKILLFSIIAYMTFCLPLTFGDDNTKDIQNMLDQQMQGWNEGNIEKYMSYYWNSGKLTFQSGNKRLQGWNELLAMYKTKYSGENMGTLKFSDIEISMLSADNAYVLGRWKVTLKDTVKEGVFTLIVQRMKEGWRIIHDHSS